MIQKFNVEALASIDGGRVKRAVEHYLERALADCRDRPTLKEARKVTLTISLTPVADDADELDSCTTEFSYSESLPKRRSKAYDMKAGAEGEPLFFNDLSPDDVHQRTLDEPTESAPANSEQRPRPRKVN